MTPCTHVFIATDSSNKSLVHDCEQYVHLYSISRASKTFVDCQWQDLTVGSIVRVHADETVPADILLLSSTSSENTCYLDTSAIDGESNLKQKSIPSCLINISRPEEIDFELQCDPANDDIYRFHGRIVLSSDTNAYPCDNNHFLLRGCVIRITDYIDGLVVYAGK
jgi:phospholipid-translocating ATPase